MIFSGGQTGADQPQNHVASRRILVSFSYWRLAPHLQRTYTGHTQFAPENAGQNTLNDVIRQATIYAFAKTPVSVPDDVVKRDPSGDLWRDWSDEVRSIGVAN